MFDDLHDLAGQTALLSLNAMIEAARAGDAGRPFAGAAEDLFRMAQQSVGDTADETTDCGRGKTGSLESTADLDRYRLAIHQELGKISAIADALDNQATAAVDSLQSASTSADVVFCDQQLAQDLLALAELIKCKKSGIEAALASDTIELDAKIDDLRWALDDRDEIPPNIQSL